MMPKTGKRTLVVKIGARKAKFYHFTLIALSMGAACFYMALHWNTFYQLLFLVSFPLLIRNMMIVMRNENARDLDPELKKLAMSTLLFSLSFGLGLIL